MDYWNIVGYMFDEYWYIGPSSHLYSSMGLVIQDVEIFRGLTGSQRDTPGLGRHNINENVGVNRDLVRILHSGRAGDLGRNTFEKKI